MRVGTCETATGLAAVGYAVDDAGACVIGYAEIGFGSRLKGAFKKVGQGLKKVVTNKTFQRIAQGAATVALTAVGQPGAAAALNAGIAAIRAARSGNASAAKDVADGLAEGEDPEAAAEVAKLIEESSIEADELERLLEGIASAHARAGGT